MGLGERDILRGFAARHALALTLKDAGDVLLALFAGIAVVEWVFGWPGAGAQFVHAVALEDWPEAAAIVFVIALLRMAADLIGGLAAGALLGWDNA
jgi:peptide/nickel transport system permease protein